MSYQLICMADDPIWKAERRKRVTGSDMLCFLGMEPSWWSTSWSEILHHKMQNTDREFDLEGAVNVAHGRRAEKGILQDTTDLLGMPATPHAALYTNDRWPYLGATLDGLLWTQRSTGPDLDLSTQTGLVAETYERLTALRGPGMVECKNARYPFRKKDGTKSWFGSWPDYHEPQIQTGMHVADFEWCLLVARLGGRDLAPHLVLRDPSWAERLDMANDTAFAALKSLWGE